MSEALVAPRGAREAVRAQLVSLLRELWACGGMPRGTEEATACTCERMFKEMFFDRRTPAVDHRSVAKEAMKKGPRDPKLNRRREGDKQNEDGLEFLTPDTEITASESPERARSRSPRPALCMDSPLGVAAGPGALVGGPLAPPTLGSAAFQIDGHYTVQNIMRSGTLGDLRVDPGDIVRVVRFADAGFECVKITRSRSDEIEGEQGFVRAECLCTPDPTAPPAPSLPASSPLDRSYPQTQSAHRPAASSSGVDNSAPPDTRVWAADIFAQLGEEHTHAVGSAWMETPPPPSGAPSATTMQPPPPPPPHGTAALNLSAPGEPSGFHLFDGQRQKWPPLSPHDILAEQAAPGFAPPGGQFAVEFQFSCPDAIRENQLYLWWRQLAKAGIYADMVYAGTPHSHLVNARANHGSKCTPCVKLNMGVSINWFVTGDGRLRLDGQASRVVTVAAMCRNAFAEYKAEVSRRWRGHVPGAVGVRQGFFRRTSQVAQPEVQKLATQEQPVVQPMPVAAPLPARPAAVASWTGQERKAYGQHFRESGAPDSAKAAQYFALSGQSRTQSQCQSSQLLSMPSVVSSGTARRWRAMRTCWRC